MNQLLSLVTLGVSDMARSRAFYERLGWKASLASCDHVCFFQTGSMAVALYPMDHLLNDSGKTGTAPVAGGITLGINVSNRLDVDRELAAVLECGATLLQPANDTPWGGRTAYFSDPDGHPWEITWAPMFPLGPDGALLLP
ncbi:MAG: VOC family protein [Magnetococcales bacterium]|nr:VOC family protein [Magnetococcales bacterium]MBF0150970.1 VOC family protein [Magnetococcales bacterium]MBF0172130.1 VOC family protein [Magnetococcales bacterium]MBF0346695.1 VOC family protein [Magnetococcales bacterium]MBF0629905.1 VOC family protein [Magnetococcales bacterium]